MESAQLATLFQARYIVNVISIGREKPVIFLIVKLTVGALIMATVI